MNLKSITTRITLMFGALIITICAGLAICAYLSSSDALKEKIDDSLLELAKADSMIISEKVSTQLNALEALANSSWLKGNDLTMKEKLELLQDEVQRSGHKSMMIADTNGICNSTAGGDKVDFMKERIKKHYLEKELFRTLW